MIALDSGAMEKAFGDEVVRTTSDAIPAGIADATARRVLTEVGVPEHVVGCIFFKGVDGPIQTLGEFNRNTPTSPELVDLYVIAVSDFYMICLDGRSGVCVFLPADRGLETARPVPAASGLDGLVDFARHLAVALSEVESDADDEELDRLEDRLIEHLRAAESGISPESEEAWRTLIRRCVGEVMI